MSDRCPHCDTPLHVPPGCAPDRYHEVSGHAQMPPRGLRATALDGTRVAPRIERALSSLDVTGMWTVHEGTGLVSWLFGLRPHTRVALDAVAAQLGIALVETASPGGGEWFCGQSDRARYLQRESNVETASTFYADTPATRALLAAKARGQVDRDRDSGGVVRCVSCTAVLDVGHDPDRARASLAAHGWRRAGERWACGARCAHYAPPPAPVAPLPTVGKIADVSYQAAMARARGLPPPAPMLTSDATTRGLPVGVPGDARHPSPADGGQAGAFARPRKAGPK